MRRALLGATAFIAVAGTASAADLPYRAAPQPVYIPPAFTWTGLYVGVNAGYGFETRNESRPLRTVTIPGAAAVLDPANGFTTTNPDMPQGSPFDPLGAGPTSATTIGLQNAFCGSSNCGGNRSGFVGGGQIGFNYQITPGSGLVIGVEADAQYAGLDRNSSGGGNFGQTFENGTSVGAPPAPLGPAPLGPVTPATITFADPNGFGRQNIQAFGTVRGRLGYAIDRVLLYATGGIAFASRGRNRNDNFFGQGTSGCLPSNCATSSAGWVAGGGLEYAFTNNITAKVEGLYVSLDRRTNNGGVFGTALPYAADSNGVIYSAPLAAFSATVNTRREDTFAVVRAGLNYKFSYDAPAAAPVVARY